MLGQKQFFPLKKQMIENTLKNKVKIGILSKLPVVQTLAKSITDLPWVVKRRCSEANNDIIMSSVLEMRWPSVSHRDCLRTLHRKVIDEQGSTVHKPCLLLFIGS